MTTIIENPMVLAAIGLMACPVLVCVIGGWSVIAVMAGVWLLLNAAIVLRAYQLSRRRVCDGVP
ncbi:hypothetical protein BH10ACT9_BH10ACT9_24380 [soil metagenome]